MAGMFGIWNAPVAITTARDSIWAPPLVVTLKLAPKVSRDRTAAREAYRYGEVRGIRLEVIGDLILLGYPCGSPGTANYGPASAKRIALIRLCQDAGFTLAEVRVFVAAGSRRHPHGPNR